MLFCFAVSRSDQMFMTVAGSKQESLAVCYLRHAFALGEHYNSVIPAEADTSEDEEEFEQVTSSS